MLCSISNGVWFLGGVLLEYLKWGLMIKWCAVRISQMGVDIRGCAVALVSNATDSTTSLNKNVGWKVIYARNQAEEILLLMLLKTIPLKFCLLFFIERYEKCSTSPVC